MNLNRRDVLRGLAALGISLAAAPTLAAESEEWRQKENGVYVMPEAEAITPFRMIGMAVGREAGDPYWANGSIQWDGYPQADGSLRLVYHPFSFDRDAKRDPGSSRELVLPPDMARQFADLLRHDDPRRPCLLAVERIAEGATAKTPLHLASFNTPYRHWKIIDDRAAIRAQHAPYNCIVTPEAWLTETGGYHPSSRHTEQYLAQVVWREEDGKGNPRTEADRLTCWCCGGEGVIKYADDDDHGDGVLSEEPCVVCEGRGWW